LIPAEYPSLDTKELAIYSKESVLPASIDTPPSCALDIPSPTCSLAQAEQPTLDILELGPDIREPSPICCQDPVPDSILVLLKVQHHSSLTPVASTEKWDHPIPIHSCSLDTLFSLAFDVEPTIPIPSCSLGVKRRFEDLCSLDMSLSVLPLVPTLKLPLLVTLDKLFPPSPLSPPMVQPTLDIELQGAYDELAPYNESRDHAAFLPSSSRLTMVLLDARRMQIFYGGLPCSLG